MASTGNKIRVKVAAGVSLFLFLGLLFLVEWRRKGMEAGQQPISPAPRVRLKEGAKVVVMDKSIQTQSGIKVLLLEGAVPLSAQVWLNGENWVYVEKASGEFEKVKVSRAKPGDRIVIQGGQMLLSEEFRQLMPANEDDD